MDTYVETRFSKINMVTIEKVADCEGNTMTLGISDGQYTVPWPSIGEQAQNVLNLHLNSNDVILAGYAKSGTHWLWEIISMLIKGEAEPSKSTKERLMFSFGTQQDFDKFPSPRLFNTHARYKDLPYVLRPNVNKTKIIHLLRNPKDVAVSFYHHLRSATDFDYDGTWNGFYSMFVQGKVPGGSWFDYVIEWNKAIESATDCPILKVFYEHLQKDCCQEIKRLSEFLGLKYSTEFYHVIADKCKFKSMKQNDEILKEQFPIHMSKDGKNFIYRKGIVGDWKNYFTVTQNEEMDQMIQTKLSGSKLKFLYSV